MTAMRFPIGIESFPVLREGGFVYVDKTEYVRKLVDGNGYYFLSRPRRFGKSLLLSTIRHFLRGDEIFLRVCRLIPIHINGIGILCSVLIL